MRVWIATESGPHEGEAVETIRVQLTDQVGYCRLDCQLGNLAGGKIWVHLPHCLFPWMDQVTIVSQLLG